MAAAPLECSRRVLGNGNDGVTVSLGTGGLVSSSGPSSIAIFLDTCQVQPGSPICRNTEPSAFVNNSGQIVGSEYAIFSTGITSIKNNGTITGSIHAEVDGSLDNARGGVLNTGRTIDLGPNGLLSNAGTIAAGGAGRIATTEVTARLEQTSYGQARGRQRPCQGPGRSAGCGGAGRARRHCRDAAADADQDTGDGARGRRADGRSGAGGDPDACLRLRAAAPAATGWWSRRTPTSRRPARA